MTDPKPTTLAVDDTIRREYGDPAFWLRKAAFGDPQPAMPKACHDCAVTCGLYTGFTLGLSLQPRDVQIEASRRWWCHNAPDRACGGNIDLLGIRAELEAADA